MPNFGACKLAQGLSERPMHHGAFFAPGFCAEVDIAHTFPSRHFRCIFMYIKTTIKKPMDIKTIIKWAL